MDFRAKGGSVLTALMFSRIVQIAGESFILTIFHDITDEKRLKNQLQQAQKMEAIGTLAGGIAHDFNNILGIIIGNTELAIDDVPDWNPAKECLLEIRQASLRAKDVVRQILSFSHQSLIERKPISATSIIEETLKLLRASIPVSIDINREFSVQTDTILADQAQISQIVMNLCTNAAQAMGDGGVLDVRLRDVAADEVSDISLSEESTDRYLKLTVKDTGYGIDQEHMDQIFDPYFTTKKVGEGTGMGLAVVNGIVQKHDGYIAVKSDLGIGTTVDVYLPLIDEDAAEDIKESEALPTGAERILFVDDEPGLVRTCSKMLQTLGYDVVSCTDPEEALSIFKEQRESIDLVITDMSMPKMNGGKLTREINKIRSDTPVILCSGYSDLFTEDEAAEIGITAFFMKPIARENIAITIRKVLDERTYLGNNERILFVDNNEELLRTYTRALTEFGYQVSPFHNPLKAQEAIEDKPDQFDMVITDLRMTEMSGFELAKKILEIRSDIPIILCSGYDEKSFKDEAEKIGIKAFINKAMGLNSQSKIIYKALNK